MDVFGPIALLDKYLAAHQHESEWSNEFPYTNLRRLLPELADAKGCSVQVVAAHYDPQSDDGINRLIKVIGDGEFEDKSKFSIHDYLTRKVAAKMLREVFGIPVPEKEKGDGGCIASW